MTTMRFDGPAVAELVDDALRAEQHLPTLTQTIERFCRLRGQDPNDFDFGDRALVAKYDVWRRATGRTSTIPRNSIS